MLSSINRYTVSGNLIPLIDPMFSSSSPFGLQLTKCAKSIISIAKEIKWFLTPPNPAIVRSLGFLKMPSNHPFDTVYDSAGGDPLSLRIYSALSFSSRAPVRVMTSLKHQWSVICGRP